LFYVLIQVIDWIKKKLRLNAIQNSEDNNEHEVETSVTPVFDQDALKKELVEINQHDFDVSLLI
jgi:hypothetical protein